MGTEIQKLTDQYIVKIDETIERKKRGTHGNLMIRDRWSFESRSTE